MIRALIVDDLGLARDRVRRLLGPHADVAVVGEAADAAAATALVLETRPDLLMLDIAMPGMSGLDLARSFTNGARPLVVFLTAHAEHAVPSYDVGAVDYLLKPVDGGRLALALDRVRAALSRRSDRDGDGGVPPVSAPDGARTTYVAVVDIDYVEVAGHYLCLHVGRETHLLREPLVAFAERLAPAGFVRVHRSVLVRPCDVVEVTRRRNGDADLTLRCGAVVPMSRAYGGGLNLAGDAA